MTALSKYLVLLALFLSASHANALSLVAGNQVRVIHLIWLHQPMSNPKNEPSCKPIHELIKRMDLNAELLNNLSRKKTRVAYSEPKQDAELPSNITDLTNTHSRGLCHGKNIRAGIFSGAANCCNQQFPNALPVAFDPSASSILPAALDPSANPLLSATLDLRSARPSNFSAGLGLRSASTTNLSAALDLHSASFFNSNKTCSAFQPVANEHRGLIKSKMPFTFQLIVGSKQAHQRIPQQVLVNILSSNDISYYGPNQHKSSCASLLAARSKCLNSHKSSCNTLLAARAKSLNSNKAHRMTPSLSLNYIGKSILEGAQLLQLLSKHSS